MTTLIVPRVVRHRDAPAYLGMDRNRFDAEVRPALTEIPIGDRGIAFDRLELDAWAETYIAQRGRPSRARKGETPCELGQKGSSSSEASGSSISSTSVKGSFSVSARSRKTMQKPGFGVVSSKSTTSGQSNFEQALDRLWADGAARYLMECRQRGVRSLETIGYHVKILLPYIGSLHMDDVCNDSLETFKAQRVDEDGAKNSTVNRSLEVVRTVDEPRGARVA